MNGLDPFLVCSCFRCLPGLFFVCFSVLCLYCRLLFHDSVTWAQAAAKDKAAITGGLFRQPLSHIVIFLFVWVWTSVPILTERSAVSAERALAMEVGPGGLDLTPFSRLVYRHPVMVKCTLSNST